jgi:hypothetical protein
MKIPNNDVHSGWIDSNVPDELATSSLFRFEVTLQHNNSDGKRQKIDVDILPDLDIDMEILEEQMQDVPSQYAFWAAVYSELRLSVSVAERKLKVRRGKATKFAQEETKRNGTRISVEQLKLIVESDEELIKADVNLARAHMLAGKVYHMLEALKMKHEISRSLIGLKRAEHEKSRD